MHKDYVVDGHPFILGSSDLYQEDIREGWSLSDL
jgi:hypothetical protein